MDREIKRLLKLENIPGFNLTDHEKEVLSEWKKQQKPVVPKKPTRRKKTTNEVKASEKETGELEIVQEES